MCELDAPSVLSRTSGVRLDRKTGCTYNLAAATSDANDPELAARLEACALTCSAISDVAAALANHICLIYKNLFHSCRGHLHVHVTIVQELPCAGAHLSQLESRLLAHEAANHTWRPGLRASRACVWL